MKFEDIHVGDVVRIRDWDDMVEEFGYDPVNEVINCRPVFSSRMNCLCGRVMTVTELHGSRNIITDDYAAADWFIGSDMLVPVKETNLEPFDDNDISMLLEI